MTTSEKEPQIECWTNKFNSPVEQLQYLPPPSPHDCSEDGSMVKLHDVKSPFAKAEDARNDFLIIPAKGTFTCTNFSPTKGLHIGINNDKAEVLSFDRVGYIVEKGPDCRWNECIPLNFIKRLAQSDEEIEIFTEIWESSVKQILPRQTVYQDELMYDPSRNNCFDFALGMIMMFIRKLRESDYEARPETLELLDSVKEDKETFSEKFIVERTKEAARYIILARRGIH